MARCARCGQLVEHGHACNSTADVPDSVMPKETAVMVRLGPLSRADINAILAAILSTNGPEGQLEGPPRAVLEACREALSAIEKKEASRGGG